MDALNRACEDQQFQLKLWQKLEESGGISVEHEPPAHRKSTGTTSSKDGKRRRSTKDRSSKRSKSGSDNDEGFETFKKKYVHYTDA
jgi:hypothetical protein